jgi:thiol-disulfide isomerase/thioredoxin
MKNIISIILLLLTPYVAFLQPSTDVNAPYFQNISYPNIKLRLTDSTTIFTKENIPKDKTVVILFFSPDCEHCQTEAKTVFEKKDSLQDIFMIWNANMVDDFNQVRLFNEKFELNTLNNVVLGKEVDYYLPIHFRIERTPYAAVFKNGKLFAEFRDLKIENLIAINYDTYKPIVNYSVFKPLQIQKSKRKKKK